MTRREKTAVRRQQIVEATFELLADVPLAALTTRGIARHLNLSQPALFRHYRSRDALLVAVVTHAREQLGGLIEPVLDAGPGTEQRLRALAMGLLSFVEGHPGLPRLLFGDLHVPSGDKLKAALRQLVSMQRKLVTELVRLGQRGGELRATLDPKRAALLFVAMLQGAILQWELTGRTASLADEGDPLVTLWLHGAAAGERPAEAVAAATDEAGPTREGALRILDVRPLLDAGEDPLDAILAELELAGPQGALSLTAPFRPEPLLALLARRGHGVEAREGPPGTWSVEVVVADGPAIVDLRDYPAPEPLEQVLERSGGLPPGGVFLARLPRYPRLLVPRLEERGLRWAVHEQPDGAALLYLTRPS